MNDGSASSGSVPGPPPAAVSAESESSGESKSSTTYRWVVLGAVWGLYVGFGLVASSLAPLVGTISDELGLSRAQMGSVLGAWQLIYLGSAVPAGRLLGRIGLRWGLTIGIVLIVVSGVLRASAAGWTSLFAAVAVFGLGGPMVSIGTPALISTWFSGDTRGPATGAAVSGAVVGSVVTLLTTNSILMPLSGDRWRVAVLIHAAGAAMAAVVWLVVTSRPPKDQPSPWRAGTGPVAGSLTLLRVPVVRTVLLLAVGTFFVTHAIGNWLPEMLRDSGLSAARASAWAAVPSLVGLVGAVVVPRLAVPDRRRVILAGTYVVMAVSMASLVGPWSIITIGGLFAMGVVRSAVTPVVMLFLMDSPDVGPTNMAAAGGLYFTAGELGGVTGPLAVGIVAGSELGFAPAQILLAGVAGAMALLALTAALRPRPSVLASGGQATCGTLRVPLRAAAFRP